MGNLGVESIATTNRAINNCLADVLDSMLTTEFPVATSYRYINLLSQVVTAPHIRFWLVWTRSRTSHFTFFFLLITYLIECVCFLFPYPGSIRTGESTQVPDKEAPADAGAGGHVRVLHVRFRHPVVAAAARLLLSKRRTGAVLSLHQNDESTGQC